MHQLEGPLSHIERHALVVLDLRRDEAVALERRAHLRRRGSELLDALRVAALAGAHRVARALGRDDDRGRRKDEMPRRMVGMRLGIDEETDRQRSELLNGREDRARVRRIVPAVDEHDPVPGEDDAAIGIEVLADVDVDPVLELPNLRAQILRGREAGGEERDEDREYSYELEFHGAPLTCCRRVYIVGPHGGNWRSFLSVG